MKLNRKKIIAREFLLSLSCILIMGLAFIGTYPYNYVVNSKIDRLEKSIIPLTDEISVLEKSINAKLSKQKWFYNENEKRNTTGSYNSYADLWERLEYLQKSDSIIFKWNNVWNSDLKKIIKEIGFQNAKEFDKFINENIFNADDYLNFVTIDSIKAEVANIRSKITSKKYKILDIDDQLYFALLFLAIAGIIAFPIRYLFYAVKWSVRILKQKDRKKIIAKEILIFIGFSIFIGLSYLGLEIREISQIKEIQVEIQVLNTLINNNQKKIDSINNNGNTNIEKLWNDLKDIFPGFTISLSSFKNDMNDTIMRKELYKNLKKRKPLTIYDNFDKTYLEFSNYLGFSSELAPLINEKYKIMSKIYQINYNKDKDELLWILSIICFIIIYPIRGIIFLIKWSIRTLKE